MKNICIFTNTLFSGGAEKQAVLLAKALNPKYQVWLVVYYGEQVEQKFLDIIEENNIVVVYLRGTHLMKISSFYRFLKREKILVIFSYLLTTNFIGGIVGKIAGVKYFYPGIRNAELPKKKEKIQKFIQNSLSTKTIYNNYRGFEELEKNGFNKQKGIVIPNCFINNIKPIVRSKNDVVRILSLGRFVEQKDWFTALNAIKRFRALNKNFKYYIVGYGELEAKIRKWIKANNVNDYIEIIINPKDLNEYYRNADIYLQTSLYEGLSNTVLEAMSFSLPLVLTDAGDNDRLVYDGENGFLCNVGDVNQISKKLGILINSFKKRIEFGNNSYQKLIDNYSYGKFQRNYIKLINDLKEEK